MIFQGYIGDGRKFDSQERVWGDELKELFGFTPFKGTLNIAIRPIIENEYNFISGKNVIKPFEDFSCVEGEFNNVKCYFCYSNKRKHSYISTFYVISDVHLRSKFDLKKKDWININIK